MPFRAVNMLLLVVFASAIAVNSQSCPVRYVTVDVLDKQGRTIPNLTAGEFRAYYHGHRMNVQSVSFRRDPSVRTIVLLDTSASMRGPKSPDKWNIARSAALAFVSSMPAEAPVSLFTFSTVIEHQFDSTSGRKAIQDWLDNAEVREARDVKGKTALYSTILEALRSLEPARPGDSIYVITDGNDNASAESASRISRELQSSGVRLFAFLLSDIKFRAAPATGSEEFYNLARASGGMAFNLDEEIGTALSGPVGWYSYDRSAGLIQQTARWAQDAIDNFYILSVSLPDDARTLGDWRVEIVDRQGKKRKDVLLACPSRILGCAANSSNH